MNKNFAEHYNRRTYFLAGLIWGLLFLIFLPNQVLGQDYKRAVGLRLAYGGLMTYKESLNEQNYLEGILAIRWGGFEITGLFEYQKDWPDTDLSWYGGAGMHFGVHSRENEFQPSEEDNETVQINLGMNIIGGVEYVFPSSPFVISADYKPSFSFTGSRWFVPEGFGLSARYIIQ